LEVDEDGLCFDAETVEAERISEDANYEGVRVTFLAYLERANIPIQIDIGFGDIVTPAPSETDYPTLLEFPRPRLLVYPKDDQSAVGVPDLFRYNSNGISALQTQ
jgi:hypothetical protein